MPLREYKFDRNILVVVKRTPKWKRTLIRGIEKAVIEGFEESTLWDVSGPNVARVGVETLVVIARMDLAGQSSSKVMAKKIVHLKQLATQAQNELAKNIKKRN